MPTHIRSSCACVRGSSWKTSDWPLRQCGSMAGRRPVVVLTTSITGPGKKNYTVSSPDEACTNQMSISRSDSVFAENFNAIIIHYSLDLVNQRPILQSSNLQETTVASPWLAEFGRAGICMEGKWPAVINCHIEKYVPGILIVMTRAESRKVRCPSGGKKIFSPIYKILYSCKQLKKYLMYRTC